MKIASIKVDEAVLDELEAAMYDVRTYTRVSAKFLEMNPNDPECLQSPTFVEFMKQSGLASAKYDHLKQKFAEELPDEFKQYNWSIDFNTGVCHIYDKTVKNV